MRSYVKKILKFIYLHLGFYELCRLLSKLLIQQIYQKKKFQDKRALVNFGFKVFSQQDEDGIIEEIFNRIGIKNKKFIELGVEDGIECNTTYLLYKGWSGFWVEGNRLYENNIYRNFSKFIKDNQLRVLFEKINPTNVKNKLSKLLLDQEIDLISIDIGTHTYHVLKSLDFLNSRLIIAEYNPKFGPTLNWISEYESESFWDGTDYYGASLKAFEILMYEKGYKLVCCNITGVNAFFVRNDLINDKFENIFSSDYHFNEDNIFLKKAFDKSHKIRIK